MTSPETPVTAPRWHTSETVESDPEYQAHAAHRVPTDDCAYCPYPGEPDRDELIAVIEAAMPGEQVWTRAYGNVDIAPDSGDLADALIAAGFMRAVGPWQVAR